MLILMLNYYAQSLCLSVPRICDPMLGNHSKSHIRQNQTYTTSMQPHHCTISFQPKLQSTYSKQGLIHGDVKGLHDGFRHWQVSELAISSVAACFSSLNVCSVDFASFQLSRSQHNPFRLNFELHPCPTTILYYNLCPLVHPPPPTQCKTTSHVQLAKKFSSYLVGTSVSSNQCQGSS